VLKIAGAGEVHVIEPLAHRRAAALGLGAKAVFPIADEFVSGPGKGGRPLVIEATNSPLGFRDAVRVCGSEAELFLRAFRTTTPTRFPPQGRAGVA
jgi:threonine dehydrogenase-like Zn-dependent dehydrogenase